MMESIITNPRPTRAEASDVANAVLDGTDCVMLSGETANGTFPVIAVETMSRICSEAELCYDNENTYWNRIRGRVISSEAEALSASAVQMSFQIKASVIICFTITGEIARFISKYRPMVPIVAISTEDKTIKALSISAGVTCLRVPSF
jgi:pyruvate kinase